MKPEDIKRKIQLQKEYINKKIGGHGGSYQIDYLTGRVSTDYVGLSGRIKLFFINMHLWFIWKWK